MGARPERLPVDAKGNDRIDTRARACGNQHRDQRHGERKQRHGHEADRIRAAHLAQHRRQ